MVVYMYASSSHPGITDLVKKIRDNFNTETGILVGDMNATLKPEHEGDYPISFTAGEKRTKELLELMENLNLTLVEPDSPDPTHIVSESQNGHSRTIDHCLVGSHLIPRAKHIGQGNLGYIKADHLAIRYQIKQIKDCLTQKKSPLANLKLPAAGSRKLKSYNHATRVKPSELFNMELSARPDLALNKLQNKFMKTAEKQLVTKK